MYSKDSGQYKLPQKYNLYKRFLKYITTKNGHLSMMKQGKSFDNKSSFQNILSLIYKGYITILDVNILRTFRKW